jgi:hypothetical protein
LVFITCLWRTFRRKRKKRKERKEREEEEERGRREEGGGRRRRTSHPNPMDWQNAIGLDAAEELN